MLHQQITDTRVSLWWSILPPREMSINLTVSLNCTQLSLTASQNYSGERGREDRYIAKDCQLAEKEMQQVIWVKSLPY